MAKKWIKLWIAENLRGTIRWDFTAEERGVWYDLLAIAGESRHEGYLAANTEYEYPDTWIAATLNIPLKLLQRVVAKCEATDRIERTESGLRIVNWSKYQSEYERQAKYKKEGP